MSLTKKVLFGALWAAVAYGDCREAGRVFRDRPTLVRKLTAALEKADAPALAELASCTVHSGPWESELSAIAPKVLADDLVKARRDPKSGGLLPLKSIKEQGTRELYLVAFGGFQYGEPTIPNDVRVFALEHGAKGWKWTTVLQASPRTVGDVFTSNLRGQ